MQIKMLATALGSPDGVQVNTYTAGETHDLPEVLANAFLGDRVAERLDAPAKPAAAKARAKTKNAGAAPENKAS
jgi:hypothetical protein